MATLVRPRIPRTSLQNEYMPISMFNAPWVWDPPENLPETFDQHTEDLLNRGEFDSAALNPDTVQLTEDEEYNLTKWLEMESQVTCNLPSALTFPTAIEPLTVSSRVPVMPKRLTGNICSSLHSLTSSGPFVDYNSLLTRAANVEDAELPSPLTTQDFGETTVPSALATDVPSFDAMQYISSLARKGLEKEQPQPTLAPSRNEIEKRRSHLESRSVGSAKNSARGSAKGSAKGTPRVTARSSLNHAKGGRSSSPTTSRNSADRISSGGAARQSIGSAARYSTGSAERKSGGSI